MAEIDSLEIIIESKIGEVNKSLDLLISKLQRVSDGISAIKGNSSMEKMSQGAENIARNMSSVSNSISESMEKAEEKIKKTSRTIEDVAKPFENLGKGFKMEGTFDEIQAKIKKLSNLYEEAKLKEEELRVGGKVDTSGYEKAVASMVKYGNQVESLQSQISSMKASEPEPQIVGAVPENQLQEYEEWLNTFKGDIKRLEERFGDIASSMTQEDMENRIKPLQEVFDAVREKYPEATETIHLFEEELERLQGMMGTLKAGNISPQVDTTAINKIDEAKQKSKDFEAALNSLKDITPEIKETNIDKLKKKLVSTEERLENLRYELEKGSRFGTINDKSIKNLEIKIRESENAANALKEKIQELSEPQKINFEDALNELKNSISRITTPLKNLKESFRANRDDVSGYEKLGNAVDDLKGKVDSAKNDFHGFAQGILNAMKLENIEAGISRTLDKGKGMFHGFAQGIINAMKLENIDSAVASMEEKVGRAIRNGLSGIKEKAAGLAGGILNAIVHPLQSLENIFSPVLSGIKNKFLSFFDWIKNKAEGFAAIVINSLAHPFQTMSNIASAAIKSIPNVLSDMISFFKKSGNVISSIGKKIGSVIHSIASNLKNATQSMLHFGKSSKKTNAFMQQGLKNILKYTLGIRSFYVLFNRIRRAIKEGFKNLAQYSEEVNKSLSLLQNSLNQTKNSFAAMISPLLNAFAPALNQVIQLVIRATNYINQLLSALTGSDTWIRAKELTDDYAQSIKKASKEARNGIRQFDELKVISQPDSSKGSGEQTSAEDMFETLPITSPIANLAEEIKGLVNRQDWGSVGALIAEKINNGLGAVYDLFNWDNAKEKIEPFINHITETLNGLVSGVDFDLLGSTVNAGLETVFNTLNTFIEGFDFENLGSQVAKGIKAMFPNSGWFKRWSKWVGNKFAAVINTMKGFIDEMATPDPETGQTGWEQLGVTIGEGINTFIDTIPWDTLGDVFSGAFNGLFSVIGSVAKTIDGEDIGGKVGKAIQDGLNGINWETVKEAVNEVAKDLAGFLNGLLTPETMHSVGVAIAEALNTAVGFVYTFFEGLDPEDIGKSFGEGITGFAKTFDLGKLINTLALAVNRIFDILVKTVQNIHWDEALSSIVDSLSNVDIGEVTLAIARIGFLYLGAKLLIGTAAGIIAPLLAGLLPAAGLVIGGIVVTALISKWIWGDEETEKSQVKDNRLKDALGQAENGEEISVGSLYGKRLAEDVMGGINEGLSGIGSAVDNLINSEMENAGTQGGTTLAENTVNFFKSETDKRLANLRLSGLEGYKQFSERTKNLHRTLGEKSGVNITSGLKSKTNEILSGMSISGWVGWKALQKGVKKDSNDLGSDSGDSIGKGIRSKQNFITGEMKGVTKAAADSVKMSDFENAGKNAMIGLKNGMESMLSTITNVSGGIATAVLNQFKGTLEIHSPSKVMKRIGEFTMEGFELGMEGLYPSIFSSISNFGDGLEIAASPDLDIFQNAEMDNSGIFGYGTSGDLSKMERALYNAVYNATSSAMKNSGGHKVEVEIIPDENRIFKSVRKKSREYFDQTKEEPFLF